MAMMLHPRTLLTTAALFTALTTSAFAAPGVRHADRAGSARAARAATALKVSVGTFKSEKTLPGTFTLTLKGASLGSLVPAAARCTTVQEESGACPAGSQVGIGKLVVSPQPGLFGLLGSTVPLAVGLYAGQPSGCGTTIQLVMSVIQNSNDGSLTWPTAFTAGTVCARAGGVQLTFPNFPTMAATTATAASMTVDSLSLKMGDGGRYLVRPGCAKHAGGSLSLGFGSQHQTAVATLACG